MRDSSVTSLGTINKTFTFYLTTFHQRVTLFRLDTLSISQTILTKVFTHGYFLQSFILGSSINH